MSCTRADSGKFHIKNLLRSKLYIQTGANANRLCDGKIKIIMRNLKVFISYNGAAYHGFQRQDNAITVQEVLEKALGKL